MTVRLLLLSAVALLTACASVPTDPVARAAFEEANDPLEPLNRAVFAFNMEVDRVVLEPAARGYRKVVPPGARQAVRNFLHNLKSPITLANDLLQGEVRRAAETSWDFVMNSTLGVLGLFDVTNNADWEPHEEDLGQTLAVWGLKEGPYLVLPFYGPSTLRDTVGRFVDRAADPFERALEPPDDARFLLGRTAVGAVDTREGILEELNDVRRTSLDFYAIARSLYRQARNNQIRNGAPAPFGTFE
jgi:phospholipid-binding lipoprotein MlaA